MTTTTIARPYLRAALFLAGCIGSRAALAYAASVAPARTLRAMGVAGLVVAAGFFVIFAMGWRATGPEVFGDRIWWTGLRPVHGALYLAFGVLALHGHRRAWVPLAIDVALGLAAFAAHRLL